MNQKEQSVPVKNKEITEAGEQQICFVIMPISDQGDTSAEHFLRVYEDIIKPACYAAGFEAVRADEEDGTNLIQQKILKSIIDAPMCICDLSCLNPNVMFELGIRQAFDLPVVLIKDHVTKNVFDIQGLRYQEYNKALRYHDVVNFQQKLADALATTMDEKESNIANSIIRLVDMPPAKRDKSGNVDSESLLRLILSEMDEVKSRLNRYDKSLIGVQVRGQEMAESYLMQRSKDYLAARELFYKIKSSSDCNSDDVADNLSTIEDLCEQYEDEAKFQKLLRMARKLAA